MKQINCISLTATEIIVATGASWPELISFSKAIKSKQSKNMAATKTIRLNVTLTLPKEKPRSLIITKSAQYIIYINYSGWKRYNERIIWERPYRYRCKWKILIILLEWSAKSWCWLWWQDKSCSFARWIRRNRCWSTILDY